MGDRGRSTWFLVVRRAGAIILAKLQLTEGAWAEHDPLIPAPVNPWNEGKKAI
jgi:Asp-tRNA(Asn)/Glu-tRNA(Gln) amidotransferase A subunit family amidase